MLDKKEGRGHFTFQDGGKYYGEWRNDLMCGQGSLTYKNGDKYDG